MSEESTKKSTKTQITPGVGLDIGTMNIISARKQGNKIITSRQRDCFLDLEAESRNMLNLSQVPYVEKDDQLLILGDQAMSMANTFNKEIRRPLSKGLVAAGELQAMEVLSILIENVLGKPQEEGEVCCYGIPAPPLDNPGQDVIYHEAVFAKILDELGYDPVSVNEAMAVIFSECSDTVFSGIGISFGSGMTNIAMAYKTIPVEGLQFSVQRGGDWIDASSATAVGSSSSKMCLIKEKGLNLMDPAAGDPKYIREREAIAMYYRSAISFAIDNIAKQFKKFGNSVTLDEPIPIVVSGGTSLAEGFMELFTSVFEKKKKRFPIEILEIRHASNPMNAVAHGLLIKAHQEYL
jgi:hypothetical protein